MSNENRYSGAHMALAFLAGAAAGAVAAVLSAPQSGRETREQVRKWAQDVGDKATHVPGAVRQASSRAFEAARGAFRESLEQHQVGVETDKI